METDRLDRWKKAARFIPCANDLLYAQNSGLYGMQDRVALIIKWRHAAEDEALNAILRMMYKG